jgi:hypothetical protein
MKPRAQLDPALLDHPKVFAAGELIGKNGAVIALGFYSIALMWSNHHLSDGFLSKSVVKSFPHAENPTSIADALEKVGLFDRYDGGWRIHDFTEWNLSAAEVNRRRKRDRERKR